MDITKQIKSVGQIRRRMEGKSKVKSYNQVVKAPYKKVMCHYDKKVICDKQSYGRPHYCDLCHIKWYATEKTNDN